jgi:hypothetical protein
VERGYDPDLTRFPSSWGICRTNVRELARSGTDLLFVSIDAGADGNPVYVLTSRFRVLRRLHHATARERYGRRRNMLLDLLPGDEDEPVPDRLLAYVDTHRDHLRWWRESVVLEGDKRRTRAEFLADLDAGGPVLRARWKHHVVKRKSKHYVHVFHDHHTDWRRRVEAPFLVSDLRLSLVGQPGVPFDLIREMYPSMPDPARSRYGRGHKLYSVPGLSEAQVDSLSQLLSDMA